MTTSFLYSSPAHDHDHDYDYQFPIFILLLLTPPPSLPPAGQTYGTVRRHFSEATVCGFSQGGKLYLSPPDGLALYKEDRLVLVSADGHHLRPLASPLLVLAGAHRGGGGGAYVCGRGGDGGGCDVLWGEGHECGVVCEGG